MVPRIPCELSELASDNPPINIKAHSKVRAFCFALIILLSWSGSATQSRPFPNWRQQIAYCVYYQPFGLARTFLIPGHYRAIKRRPRDPFTKTLQRRHLFVDRNILEARGQNIAIECGEERVTYQQLFERTNRAGNALRNLGVRAQERVLLLLLDTPEFLYAFFGAIKIGAVAIPVNTQAKPRDYEYILNDSLARVAIVSESLLPQLQAIPRQNLPHLREIVVVGPPDHAPSYSCFQDLMAAASPDLAPASTSKDDPAFWLYSSGSTGVPKGCVHLHHDMVVSSHHYAHAFSKLTSATAASA